MLITRKLVVEKLKDYFAQRISLHDLTHWAETAMIDIEFGQDEIELLSDIVGGLGLADVRDFGLKWEECEGCLMRLGYRAQVAVTPFA